ncbi:MAG: hypothetical protein LBL79_11620, partial [Prevotella sp.]|nr:hypothetical protein [Prevotella sp.]
SNKITIPKGEKKAVYTIKLKPRTFDQTKSYALGVKIVGTSVGIISGNYSAGVYSIPVKSPYEGKYTVHYKWLIRGGASTGEEYDRTDINLKTVGPSVVQAQMVGALYSGYTNYFHRPDGTVLPYVYSGNSLAVQVFSSSYDLDNLTFEVEYSFISPANYRLIETYTRTGDL